MNQRKIIACIVAIGTVGVTAAVIQRHKSHTLPSPNPMQTAMESPADSRVPVAQVVPAPVAIDNPLPVEATSTTSPPETTALAPVTPSAKRMDDKTAAQPTAIENQKTAVALNAPSPKPSKKEPTLPRLALSLVGADAEAELIWTSAINDPSLAPNERKDLIEDLNEDGFPDPKHITYDDLPLILSRIDLIEKMAPGAMDEVNAAAFGEAYKDLYKMLEKLANP